MKKFLPHCNRRYTLTSTGFVYEVDQLVERKNIDGEYYVYLNWINGFQFYKVTQLMLVTFNEFDISSDDWLRIVPLYYDNDNLNVKLSNLTYRYDGLIEHPEMKGFYHIPFYYGYLINEHGELYSSYSKKVKKWSATIPNESRNSKGGYMYTRLKINRGCITTTMFRHRLLCLVFKEYQANVLMTVVNHINGIPGDDRLENLEWSTYRDNNLHAFSMGLKPNSVRGIKTKNMVTGAIKEYESIAQAAKECGFDTPTLISYRIKHNPSKIYPDMLLFKYIEDESDWPVIDFKNVTRTGVAHEVFAYNVYTYEYKIFKSTTLAGMSTNVSKDTISSAIRNNSKLPLNGFIFRYRDNIGSIPVFNHDQLEIMKLNPMRVRSGYKVTMVNGDIIYITNAKLLPTDLKETKYIDIYSPVERPNPLELTGKPLVMHQPS